MGYLIPKRGVRLEIREAMLGVGVGLGRKGMYLRAIEELYFVGWERVTSEDLEDLSMGNGASREFGREDVDMMLVSES